MTEVAYKGVIECRRCQCLRVADVNIYRAGNKFITYLTQNSYYAIKVLGLKYTRCIDNLGISRIKQYESLSWQKSIS